MLNRTRLDPDYVSNYNNAAFGSQRPSLHAGYYWRFMVIGLSACLWIRGDSPQIVSAVVRMLLTLRVRYIFINYLGDNIAPTLYRCLSRLIISLVDERSAVPVWIQRLGCSRHRDSVLYWQTNATIHQVVAKTTHRRRRAAFRRVAHCAHWTLLCFPLSREVYRGRSRSKHGVESKGTITGCGRMHDATPRMRASEVVVEVRS